MFLHQNVQLRWKGQPNLRSEIFSKLSDPGKGKGDVLLPIFIITRYFWNTHLAINYWDSLCNGMLWLLSIDFILSAQIGLVHYRSLLLHYEMVARRLAQLLVLFSIIDLNFPFSSLKGLLIPQKIKIPSEVAKVLALAQPNNTQNSNNIPNTVFDMFCCRIAHLHDLDAYLTQPYSSGPNTTTPHHPQASHIHCRLTSPTPLTPRPSHPQTSWTPTLLDLLRKFSPHIPQTPLPLTKISVQFLFTIQFIIEFHSADKTFLEERYKGA